MNIITLTLFRLVLAGAMLMIARDVGLLDIDPWLSGFIGIVIGSASVWLTCDLTEKEYY